MAELTIGLGYTAVATADGGVGLSYSMIDRTACCTHVRAYRDFDDAPATELLEYLRSDDTLERTMGVALVNALNQPQALALPRDDAPGGAFMARFAVREGTRSPWCGYFPPVARSLQDAGAEPELLDRDERMGDEAAFVNALARWRRTS